MSVDRRQIAREILVSLTRFELDEITPDKDLVGDLGIDSPKALRLLVELEERLSIEIPDEDAARLSTVGDVYAYLESR